MKRLIISDHVTLKMAPTKRTDAVSNSSGTSAVDYLTESAVELVLNSTSLANQTALCPPHDKEHTTKRLHEFQIIKAVVLAVVTLIIMVSICKMVFQIFVRYSGKQDER